jgi:twitching motility protein PilJ
MARQTDRSSAFTIIAALLALALLASAGVTYFESDGNVAGDGNGAAFAAISQAIPLHATSAVSGSADGFVRLESDLQALAGLRRSTGSLALPGGAAPWDDLANHANAILENRANIDAINAAAAAVSQQMPVIITASDELLDRSGATAIIQEFQRRAAAVQLAVAGLTASAAQGNAAASSRAIATDISYLRMVTDALAGSSSNLDVTPLDASTREAVLAPISDSLAALTGQVQSAIQAAGSLEGLNASIVGVKNAAAGLLDEQFTVIGGDGGSLSGPWLSLGLLALALLLLIGLALLHGKSSIFERTAREQADQNERNQQAILRLLDELGSLADGDLTVEATVTEDITGAIADSINYAIEKLRELVATINETAIMVDSAAKQTESTAVHMARAADTQTREISAATESIVSMAGSIEEVSGNAERSSDVARHSVEVAHKGGEAVRRTIDGMNAIRETIQETSKRIKRLGESSQEIGNIVELINDIAEQTNILALNASIQASMAGEAGRGFAVVADEVQRLAERSTNATRQIEVLVRTIQADTNEAVVSMERSTTDVVGGALLAENAGAALDEIEQVSNQIANLVQNISGSARQQAGAAADVTRRTTKLREISDQTGKATTATAASISKLSELASQLRKTVAGFTLPNSALQSSALSGTVRRPATVTKIGEKAAG